MIKILGIKRVLTLAVLVAVNLVMGAGLYLVLLPQQTRLETESNRTRSEINARYNEIETLRVEFDQIQEQKNLFEDLQASGFFSMQDRIRARQTIEQIQRESKVLAARYDIQAIKVIESPYAEMSDHVVLNSPMTVSLDALDDADIYNFIYWAQNTFPGYMGITGLTIERITDLSEASLRQIGNGIPVVLVTAQVNFSWDTMVPESELPEQLGGSAGR